MLVSAKEEGVDITVSVDAAILTTEDPGELFAAAAHAAAHVSSPTTGSASPASASASSSRSSTGRLSHDPTNSNRPGKRLSIMRWSMRPRRSAAEESEYVAPTEELIFMEVRPPVFAGIWWAMVVIHVVCATLLTIQMRLYLYLTTPYMSYYVNLLRPGIVTKYKAVACVFGVIAALHWSVVLRLVYYSLSQRKYAFYPANHYATTRPTTQAQSSKTRLTKWQRVTRGLAACRLAVVGRRGLLGVESRYFYLYMYLREAIEISSQIYQAYRGSLLVSRTWINHLSISVIVVNCVVTPVLQMAYKSRPEVRRIAILSLDAVLDFVVAMVVPVCIFLPYWSQFDTKTQSFSQEKLYDEKWFVNAVLENQEFFVVSVGDLIFKCIPHLSITTCLKKVRALLHKDTSVRDGQVFTNSLVAPQTRRQLQQEKLQRIHSKNKNKIENEHELQNQNKNENANKSSSPRGGRLVGILGLSHLDKAKQTASKHFHKYAHKCVRVVFLGIAYTVFGIHLQAILTSYKPHAVGCHQVMRPWFAPAFACSIFEVNCAKLQISGSQQEIASVLKPLFAPAIASLVFSHCAALEMPSKLQEFPHLLRLDVYNSTIVSWHDDAALTDTHHPLLVSISLARVTFPNGGELPDGLMSETFPLALRSVEIAATNLTRLPDDLHRRWRHAMARVYVESSSLTQVPRTLQLMDVEKLSLDGNAIATLPSEWLLEQPHAYFVLSLASNPLKELPLALHSSTTIRYLRLQSTNVSALPPWIATTAGVQRVFMSGTPYCATIDPAVTGDSSVAATCASETPLLLLNETDALASGSGGLFPLALIDGKRSNSSGL